MGKFYERKVYQERSLPRDPFDKSRYDRWRARIPFTDEQILEAMAARIADEPNPFMKRILTYHADRFNRTRMLSSRALNDALPRLVKLCAVCGKKALYRVGYEGRCSTHRMVKADWSKEYELKLKMRSEAICAREKAKAIHDCAHAYRMRQSHATKHR
jgi:hypothetical protein